MEHDPIMAALQAAANTPQDAVPRPVNAEALVTLLKAEGGSVTVTEPGEVTEDADGIPTGITEGTTTEAQFTGMYLAPREWEAVARYLIDKHER